MFRLKHLYRFMLQSFVPLFAMTFMICLFIVLMQFLWMHVNDLVGKGLEMSVIAELFMYAALVMVPMALPLSILLAALMTFGNLGERFELTALKASGISLIKTMKPLVIMLVFIAIGAFFFQNNVLPVAQTKMWTLLYSMRQKSPELDIPEGAFYDQIPGFNLFVKEKNRETGTLHEVMIYDVSRGFDNTRVILADSGHLDVTPDKTHLYLTLFTGEMFENLRENSGGGRGASRNMPYRQESFSEKQFLIAFDANFNRMDESGMRNQYVGKNMAELRATIDSVNHRVDSVGAYIGGIIKETPYMGINYYEYMEDESGESKRVQTAPVVMHKPYNVDSALVASGSSMLRSYLNQGMNKAQRVRQELEFKNYTMHDDIFTIRRHDIELQKKFTLSLACLVFFFIGAPLGAIIRKGGLGMPIVISVLLFIFYYIINNTGIKLARDGRLDVWEGVWLSSAVLLPLGIFITYKAQNDSAVFNADAYRNFFRRVFGLAEKRHVEFKELVMDEVEPQQAREMLQSLRQQADALVGVYRSSRSPKAFVYSWLMHGTGRQAIVALSDCLEQTVAYLANSRSKGIIMALNRMPVVPDSWVYLFGLRSLRKQLAAINDAVAAIERLL